MISSYEIYRIIQYNLLLLSCFFYLLQETYIFNQHYLCRVTKWTCEQHINSTMSVDIWGNFSNRFWRIAGGHGGGRGLGDSRGGAGRGGRGLCSDRGGAGRIGHGDGRGFGDH